MPNDAKLGLVLGLGLVVLITLVFFRKDPLTAHPQDQKGATRATTPKAQPPAAEPPPPPVFPGESPPPPPIPMPQDPLIEPAPPPLPD